MNQWLAVPISPLAPILAGVFLLAVDIAAVTLRRHLAQPPWWLRHVGYITRPLAALALINAIYRISPANIQFSPVTFPLYANPWDTTRGARAGLAGRVLLACAAAATVVVLLRSVLREDKPSPLRLVILWVAVVAAQLTAALAPMGWEGVLQPWAAPGAVYAWAARHVKDAGGVLHFFRAFGQIQADLDLHSHSHPPGATVLSYWTQDFAHPVVVRNVLTMLGLSSLCLPLVYVAGRRMFTHRTAAAAAVLFGVQPGAIAFGAWAQDTLFAVFFCLSMLLTWEITRSKRPLLAAVSAGVVLFALSMLTFSWSIIAAAAFIFVAVVGYGDRTPPQCILARMALPPLTMLLMHLAVWAASRFSYFAAYREALELQSSFYYLANSHDWILSLLGGQIGFLWGLGPVTASVFLVVLAGQARRERRTPFFVFLWAVLSCYGAAMLFGPNALKLEVVRCWFWVGFLPVLAAAARLDADNPGDERPLLLAAAASFAVSLVSVVFLDFGS